MVPGHWSANDCVGQLGLGIGHRAASLLDLAARGVDLLMAWSELHQIVGLLQRRHLRHALVVAGLRIVQRLGRT